MLATADQEEVARQFQRYDLMSAPVVDENQRLVGVVTVDDNPQAIVCVTTPRVIHDIRTNAGSNWLAVEQYAGAARKFSGEVGVTAVGLPGLGQAEDHRGDGDDPALPAVGGLK